jgi:hypothetical protein
MGRVVHGVFRIDSIINQAGTVFHLSNGVTSNITQMVPYNRDTEGRWRINRNAPTENEIIMPSPNDMMLIKRPDGLIDIGKCIRINEDIDCVTYTVFSYTTNRWEPITDIQKSCSMADVLCTGFKFNKHKQFKRKDRILWQTKGWDI